MIEPYDILRDQEFEQGFNPEFDKDQLPAGITFAELTQMLEEARQEERQRCFRLVMEKRRDYRKALVPPREPIKACTAIAGRILRGDRPSRELVKEF